jgi:speckle-type POZ protein
LATSDLLSSGDGADVTLEVEGETFMAHRSILTAGSPVFKAELFSPTEVTSTTVSSVSIKAIEPRVFKALLHFIYTDSLPEIDDKGEKCIFELKVK